MKLRKLALQLPLLLLLLISFTVDAFAQGQQAYRYLSDFSYMTKDRRSIDEKADDFTQALARGDRRAFQVVEYEVLQDFIVGIAKEAPGILKNEDFTKVGILKAFLMQMSGDMVRNRATLVQATLPGIFNLDPRVRLVAASWLRVLKPDITMLRAVKLAVGVDIQVIRYDRATDDFVFTHPKILETVASWEEYYREKDIDFPGVFAPGAIETIINGKVVRIGGQGVNVSDTNKKNNDGSKSEADVIVTGLDARRWGNPTVYDQTRDWEKALPRTGAPNVNLANQNDISEQPSTLGDYLRRLNAALSVAKNGVEVGDYLPNGKVFDGSLYGMPNPGDWSDLNNPMVKDRNAINDRALDYLYPNNNIVVKPIAGDSVKDPAITDNRLEATPDHQDAYRYYPDMTEGGTSLKNLPADQRRKMELLLHQNWQMGTRVPIGQGRMYVYINGYGEMVVGNPWVELTKLDMFVTRFAWYNKVKSGYRNALAILSKDTCSTLYMSIDGETPDVIPFLSVAGPTPMFDYKDVPVFIEGLRKNRVFSCQYAIMRVLKDIYEQKPPRAPLTPPEVQREINIALWEFKRESNRADVEVGKVLYNEAITVGKAPAKPAYTPPLGQGAAAPGGNTAVATLIDPYSPFGEDATATVNRFRGLGFALPNSEVLANSNRAIVSDNDVNPNGKDSTGNAVTRVDSKVAYSLDRLFKQRFFLLYGPDGKPRDYYQHRADYTRLWNDTNMTLMRVDMGPAAGTVSNRWWANASAASAKVNAAVRQLEPINDPEKSILAAASDFDEFPPNAVVNGAGKNHTGTVTDNVTFWEAARYVDSLIGYNIERMTNAQNLINEILKGNRRFFMEARWEDVESMVILTLKRLETLHKTRKDANVVRENPLNVLGGAAGNGPVDYNAKPEYTFFDVFENLKVVEKYKETDPGVRTKDLYVVGNNGNYRNVGKDAGGVQVQLRQTQEFLTIVDQIKSITKSTYSEEKRRNIIQAALGGLFNKDPRVRLTAMHFLRRLGPDATMLPDVEKARSINSSSGATIETPEVDDYRSAFIDTYEYRRFGARVTDLDSQMADYYLITRHKYEGALDLDVESRARGWATYDAYVQSLPATAQYQEEIPHPNYEPSRNEYNRIVKLPTEGGANTVRPARFYGFYQLKAPSEELEKLYKMIRRDQLVRQIKSGDVNAVRKMTRSEFTILAEAIDAEWRGYIPLQSFHSVAADYKQGEPGYRVPSDLAVFNGRDIRVLKAGIDNSNFLVQKGMAEYLIRFYNFYDRCTDFRTRGMRTGCQNGLGYEPKGTFKKEIQDALYYYINDAIVVQEFELAFNGENPDGRAVIRAGTDLAMHLNPGGERVYLSLPERIRKDIRDAVWGDYERLPEELKYILGIISTRAPRPNVLSYHNVMLGLEPRIPWGDAGEQLNSN